MFPHAAEYLRRGDPMTAASPTQLDAGLPQQRGGGRLDSRDNALNLFRLVLASAVFVSHSFSVAGAGPEPRFAGESLGGWAVIGFFVISGYLITASRVRSDLGRYLVQRIARIYPAFLACMIITAVVFAPIAFVVQNGSLGGFLTTANTPVNYVFANMGLKIGDYSVAGTLADVPYPYAWNGPLWTLYYEFVSYLVVGFAMIFAVVRRTPWVMVGLFVLSVLARANLELVGRLTGGNQDVVLLSKLLPYFLGGAVVFLLRDKIPLRWWVALPALAVGILLAYTWNDWGGQAAAPLFALAIFWFASWCPSPAVVRSNDISYGMYIYAWPVQQLLALASVHEQGQWVYNIATGLITAVLATASWLLLERPVMRRVRAAEKSRQSTSRVGRPAGHASPVGTPGRLTVPDPTPAGAVVLDPAAVAPRHAQPSETTHVPDQAPPAR